MLKRNISNHISIINIIQTHNYSTIIEGLAFDKYPINNQNIDPNIKQQQKEEVHRNKSIVFLHGILGNKKNWRTPSNIYVKNHPEYQGIAIDHRGHGKSTHKELSGIATAAVSKDSHTVYSCVLDLIETFKINKIKPTILCGHSFSGKVVLLYLETILKLQQQQEEEKEKTGTNNHSTLNICNNSITSSVSYKDLLPEHVWILDSIPGPYNFALDQSQQEESVVHIMNTLSNLPDEFESKEAAAQLLTNQGVSKPIVQWLTSSIISTATTTSNENSQLIPQTNLPQTSTKYNYKFAFNKVIVQELFHDFCQLNMWDFLENYNDYKAAGIKIHFIRAGKNPAWNQEVLDHFHKIIEKDKLNISYNNINNNDSSRSNSSKGVLKIDIHNTANNDKNARKIYLHTMSHVGHWLHAEDVHGMLQVITNNSK